MNNHLKLAYDYGVHQALRDAGITKTAAGFGAEATYGDVIGKHTPATRQLSRGFHTGLGAAFGGGIGAIAGGGGLAGLGYLLSRGRIKEPAFAALGVLGAGAGGLGGTYAGALRGAETSMENDPAMMRYMRGARRAIGLE